MRGLLKSLIPYQEESIGSIKLRKILSISLIVGLLQAFSWTYQIAEAPKANAAQGLQFYVQNTASWSVPPSAINESTSGYCNKTISSMNGTWGSGNAFSLAGCSTDNFTVYGIGYIQGPYTGTVNFCNQADDQFYLIINSNVIINDNTAKAAATGTSCNATGTMNMVAGTWYPIQAWMHEQGGGADMRLLWNYPGATTNTLVDISYYRTSAQLSTPTSVSASAAANEFGQFTVSWSAVSNVSSYRIKLYNAAGNTLLATKSGVASNATSNIFTSSDYSQLSNGTSYKVTVTAIGDGSNYEDSAESSQASVTTSIPTSSITDFALNLNGSSQYAAASGAQVIPTSTASAFTVEAWINQPASRSSEAFYQILSQGSLGNVFYAKVVNGSVRFGRSGYTGGENHCTAGVPTNEWTHVALVVGASSQSCYINGSLAGSFTQSGGTAIGTTLAVGQFVPTGGEFFLGQIDEVKIWSDARTQVEIQSDLKSYGGTLVDNLVAYYDFNELVGSRIYNRSTGGSSAFDLTTANAPTIASTSIFETSTVQAYTVVKFMRTFLVAAGGWTSPASRRLSVLVVGGGGGGGAHVGGGGGGGGVIQSSTVSVTGGANVQVVVGSGGIGARLSTPSCVNPDGPRINGDERNDDTGIYCNEPSNARRSGNGQPSSFANLIADGGGGGGSWNYFYPRSGGSGGGSSHETAASAAGTGTVGQGNTGGSYASLYATGGGGGAGGPGGNGVNTGTPGNGGVGITSTITGQDLQVGGGGGGGQHSGSVASTGSFGGGNGRAATSVKAFSGNPNTGGGGGGSGNTSAQTSEGGDGGSGIVIIRYITNLPTILTQPLSDTTTAGIVETFTVTTSAAPAPLTKSVQWQFTTDTATGVTGWTNVSSGTGGTTDTFTTLALTTSMNKYRYRVIITFSDTSTISVQETSTVAILTINPAITITSDTSTITRKYGAAQTTPRTLIYSGGTTSSGAVGTSTSHTVRGAFGTLASGKIVLDTSTSTVVFRVDTGTAVGTYVETITVTDFKGATATYSQTVVVTPADTLTVQADTLTAITYNPAGMTINPTVTITGLVASDSATSTTFKYSAPGSNCANGGTCSLGDSGPGGGKVFYVSGSTYFEAAPRTWYSSFTYNGSTYNNANTVYCANGSNQKIDPYNPPNNTSSTGWGGGKTNTDAFKSYCSMGAIGLIKSYAGGGKSDWYIPNATEMNGLVNYWSNVSGLLTQFDTTTSVSFWTSDASYNATYGWLLTQPYFNASRTWSGSGSAFNHQGGKILPIRSFTADGSAQPALIATVTKPTNAGIFTITPSALLLANNVDTSNYVWVDYRTSTFTINKARQDTLTVSSVLGVFETGTATMKITTLGGTDTGTVTYAIATGGSASGCSVSSNVLTVTSVGTCKLVATKDATLNYLITLSDTATVTFSRFVSRPLQVQLYPSMIPLNQGNALETTTLTIPAITSISFFDRSTVLVNGNFQTIEPYYEIIGSGFTGTTRVVLNFSELTPFTLNSDTKITFDAGGVGAGIIFIETSDGRIGPTPFYNFTP